MSGFFKGLVSAAQKVWHKLTHNWLTDKVSELYASAVDRTADFFLRNAYERWDPVSRFFSTRFGRFVLRCVWTPVAVVMTPIFPLYDASRGLVVTVTKITLTGAAYAWYGLSWVFVTYWSFEVWLTNAEVNLLVRGWLKVWRWATLSPNTQQYTRYVPFKNVLAHEHAALVVVEAGAARLFRRIIGDAATHRQVTWTTNFVARVHPPTYDFWFDQTLPYDTPDGEQAGLFLVEPDPESEKVAEKEKVANFFASTGFVLIKESEDAERSATDVFNEYVTQRWADLDAAEIATDRYGRTWAVPRPGKPLFKGHDVSTHAEGHRLHADPEISWMTEQDPLARAHGYGRHWIAALADQDTRILTDPAFVAPQRAMFLLQIKGVGVDQHHALVGFDEKLAEMLAEMTPETESPGTPTEPEPVPTD